MTLDAQIRQALKMVKDPFTQKDILSSGIAQGLKVVENGKISLVLEVDTMYLQKGKELKDSIEARLKGIDGVREVNIALTASRKPQAQNSNQKPLPHVKHCVAIASGKGGVGKSTVTVNLACALQQKGLAIGILDADVYGPSLPRLLGTSQKPTSEDGKTMSPIIAYGIKSMSMGYMLKEGAPAIWRGPMAQQALQQMLHQTNWGELDFLLIDLPPGTGDIHLSLAQSVLLSGAIIVSTPQDLALIDARRGLDMFLKVKVPVLGLVENMSYFMCPHCSGRSDIFDTGGVRAEAEKIGLPLLAEIPLHMDIREASEKGTPLIHRNPDSPESLICNQLASVLINTLASQ